MKATEVTTDYHVLNKMEYIVGLKWPRGPTMMLESESSKIYIEPAAMFNLEAHALEYMEKHPGFQLYRVTER